MAKHWKDMNLSDADLRALVWKSGSPTVQAPFAQAVKNHLGRDIWNLEKFKADVRDYLTVCKHLSEKVADDYMSQFDGDMHDFMYHGLSMDAIASAILKK